MVRTASAAIIGVVFGLGITLAGMSNPAKVLDFFDPLGTWDPSLLVVMVSALAVTFVGYNLVLRRPAPVLGEAFHLPTRRDLDLPLIGGAALFGIGWGIAGFCPGGAIPALGQGELSAGLFVVALLGGILVANGLRAALLNKNRSSAELKGA